MRKKYTHLFFDLDNTLWDFEKNSKRAMKDVFDDFLAEKTGVAFDSFFDKYQTINKALWQQYRNKELGKKELIQLRFSDTLSVFNIKGVDPLEMNERYLGRMPEQKLLNDGCKEILDYLKERRYLLYIITNGFKEVQTEKLNKSGLTDYFARIFISEEVKAPKPSQEIFEYAVKSVNAKKTNSLMIGDDWEVDVMGAHHFGMDAVHYKSDGTVDISAKESNRSKKIYTISTLSQLHNFL